MRVWALAKELGKESSELVAELKELGFDVTAPASGLTGEEADAIRKAYAALPDAPGPTGASGGAAPEPVKEDASATEGTDEGAQRAQAVENADRGGRDYVLARKGSISAGGVVVQKGGIVNEAVYRALPDRVHPFFDAV